jgi:hypothetical protein
VYRINDTATATMWIEQLIQMKAHNLLKSGLNHQHGFASKQAIIHNLEQLKSCSKSLGFELENITSENWQHSLNKLHTNFPDFFKRKLNSQNFSSAHKMNTLIHWLEYELANFFNQKKQYLFNLDFNHDPITYNLKRSIPDHELSNFSTNLAFGNLHLHYIYIGRHFLEMFDALDYVSPSQHFKAQHEFNATCGLVFSESTEQSLLDEQMKSYYVSRGGRDFFNFDYDNPSLAKGFFKLGQLENLDAFDSFQSREMFRNQLKQSHIVSWQFIQS